LLKPYLLINNDTLTYANWYWTLAHWTLV